MYAHELAKKYDLNVDVTGQALQNIADGKVMLLTVSGKAGAGKDSIAPPLVEKLGFNLTDAEHDFFAKPLKVEINKLIKIILGSSNSIEAHRKALMLLDSLSEPTQETIGFLWDEVKNGVVTSSYDRTPSTRKALQWWGTEVRRAEDENYWAKQSLSSMVNHLAEGKTVFNTDSRFENEIETVHAAHGKSVRLLVSPNVQSQRILDRDGIKISNEMRNHASETALDNYTNFNVIIDTDKYSKTEIVNIAAAALK